MSIYNNIESLINKKVFTKYVTPTIEFRDQSVHLQKKNCEISKLP